MRRPRQRLFDGIAAASLLTCVASTVHLCTDHVGSRPHGVQIGLPIPSDADEVLVIGFSNVEHWEYTPWDKRWYFMSGGPLVTIALSILPIVWAFNQAKPTRGMPEDPKR